jgi:hypothetical protein
MIASIAAAFAMIFAIGATFLAQQLFANYSLPWAILIILGYIFKDRIKDIVRDFLITFFPHLVADKRDQLVDLITHKKIGRIRSRLKYSSIKEIPGEILRIRKHDSKILKGNVEQENVVNFHRTVLINWKSIMRRHRRVDSITGINRINIRSWLREMDKPNNRIPMIDKGEVVVKNGKRVYHLNLVLKLNSSNQDEYFRFRLILCRDGILRIEKIEIPK